MTRVATSFVAFAVVGTAGYLVEAVLLTWFMLGADWAALPSRAVSFPLAVTMTWWLNRRFAFAGRGKLAAQSEYVGYLAIQIAGACVNFAVFAICLKVSPRLAAWPFVPLAVGACVALVFNFVMARATLYSRSRAAQTETA